MSHHHDECEEDSIEALLKALIILTCDLKELDEKQVEQNRIQILQNRRIVELLFVIAKEDAPPYLTTIQLAFKEIPMPGTTVTLTAAGQTAATVITGTGSDGNPWTGALPTATYADDNSAAATTDASGVITAVANGTDNVTASVQSVDASGNPVTLTSNAVTATVNIPAPPVTLASIQLAFV